MMHFRSVGLALGTSVAPRLSRRDFLKASGATAAGVAGLSAADSPAQTPQFAAKPILQTTVGGVEGREAVMLSITIAPGGSSGRHTHPGDCYGTVVEGNAEIRIEGREPRRVSPGEAWHTTNGTVHELKNVGDTTVRAVNTLVVQKGKPRMQPVRAD
jgi:quercetin dioxygenase-like cupin family protein